MKNYLRKILALGAMAVLASTSFSAVTVLEGEADTSLGGDATLPMQTKGRIVDTTENYSLYLKAVTNAGGSSDVVVVDFGEITGSTTNTSTAQANFKAAIVKGAPGSVKKYKFGNAKVISQFVSGAETSSDVSVNEDGTIMTSTIRTAIGTGTVAAPIVIGTVEHKLSATQGERQYDGIINSTLKLATTAVAGNFVDNAGAVTVSVTEFDGSATNTDQGQDLDF